MVRGCIRRGLRQAEIRGLSYSSLDRRDLKAALLLLTAARNADDEGQQMPR